MFLCLCGDPPEADFIKCKEFTIKTLTRTSRLEWNLNSDLSGSQKARSRNRKIEFVKPVAKRIEDEDENEDDIPERCVSSAQYLPFLITCCRNKPDKGLKKRGAKASALTPRDLHSVALRRAGALYYQEMGTLPPAHRGYFTRPSRQAWRRPS